MSKPYRMQINNFVLRLFLFPFLKTRVTKKSSPSPETPEVVVNSRALPPILCTPSYFTWSYSLSPVLFLLPLETDNQEVRIPPSYSEVESPEDILSEEIFRVHENGLTLLHLMVIQGNVEKVKFLLSFLIEHDADINMPDDDGWTPLHFAAQNGDDRIVRLLLDHQAQVNAQEHDGWTPLHLASQNNFENVARVLLSRQADSNTQEVDGKTALHVAACFGHVSLVKLLASQGADLEKKQKNHRTPLHVAVERGKFRVVHYLLKNGTSVNSLDQNHYSALHLAVVRGKYLICEKLIKYGANVELRTDKGWTPLHLLAIRHQRENIITLLQGKDSRKYLNICNTEKKKFQNNSTPSLKNKRAKSYFPKHSNYLLTTSTLQTLNTEVAIRKMALRISQKVSAVLKPVPCHEGYE
uniref:Uncharacterized protein n=1 Tax=Accipiter nisus TaxID=211598 RepID=A0A8B9MZ88_9AVES